MDDTPSNRAVTEVSGILKQWSEGKEEAFHHLLSETYETLKKLARSALKGQGNLTLQPTELIHEAYEKLRGVNHQWENKQQFYAFCAKMMRNLLVDRYRKKVAEKRGGYSEQTTVSLVASPNSGNNVDILTLDRLMNQLAKHDARKVEILELIYFAGFNQDEIAEQLGISVATVTRDVRFAKAWLNSALADGDSAH